MRVLCLGDGNCSLSSGIFALLMQRGGGQRQAAPPSSAYLADEHDGETRERSQTLETATQREEGVAGEGAGPFFSFPRGDEQLQQEQQEQEQQHNPGARDPETLLQALHADAGDNNGGIAEKHLVLCTTLEDAAQLRVTHPDAFAIMAKHQKRHRGNHQASAETWKRRRSDASDTATATTTAAASDAGADRGETEGGRAAAAAAAADRSGDGGSWSSGGNFARNAGDVGRREGFLLYAGGVDASQDIVAAIVAAMLGQQRQQAQGQQDEPAVLAKGLERPKQGPAVGRTPAGGKEAEENEDALSSSLPASQPHPRFRKRKKSAAEPAHSVLSQSGAPAVLVQACLGIDSKYKRGTEDFEGSSDGTTNPPLFDHAVFHFPHIGREDMHAHRRLLCHVFARLATSASAQGSGFRALLDSVGPTTGSQGQGSGPDELSLTGFSTTGLVHVTLTRSQCTRWDIIGSAARSGWNAIGATLWEDNLVPGYEIRRNVRRRGFRKRVVEGRGENGRDDECVCVSFVRTVRSEEDGAANGWWWPPWGDLQEGALLAVTDIPAAAPPVTSLLDSPAPQNAQSAPHPQVQVRPGWAKPEGALFWPPWPRPPQFPPAADSTLSPAEQKELSQCGTCGYFFKSEEELRAHWQNKENTNEKSASCNTCGRKFVDQRALSQHLNSCKK